MHPGHECDRDRDHDCDYDHRQAMPRDLSVVEAMRDRNPAAVTGPGRSTNYLFKSQQNTLVCIYILHLYMCVHVYIIYMYIP